MNAANMREILRKEVVEVIFKKKDGTIRNMFCTLNPNFLPEKQDDTTAGPAKSPASDTVVTVWDLDVNDWRAFKVDSVIEFNVE